MYYIPATYSLNDRHNHNHRMWPNLIFTVVYTILLSCHFSSYAAPKSSILIIACSLTGSTQLQMLGRRSVSLLAACHKIITQSKQSGKVIGEHCIIN